ncbi:HAD family hydrolase [Alteromonas sp. W364]|uniref:sulfotransferase-like domain-containing protein n=1 Tax=Alteromonas sp. W364 TaxID=3075610 RepID=UPI002885EF62|nr:HAD family hydrolase [Alteromonas sp. W364]MDT0627631.1 HAD family hydrolase [Alteromonas sp. W364]
MTIRIAMWSGPRNISTAMMRSWENREDCSVVDEPFYAYYLQQTQSPHPMFEEVLSSQSRFYNEVANEMSEGKCDTPVQYQKHMTQHMLNECDLAWAKNLRHCVLIRDPAYVVNSYTNSRGDCTANDIGIRRQVELYDYFSQFSERPIPVIDSASILASPETALPHLCDSLDIPFSDKMLSWRKGKRESDGVWASHWYHSVEASTGFAKPKEASFTLNKSQQKVVDEVMPYYEYLKTKIS